MQISKTEKLRKLMETMNGQHREEMNSIKQIQTDTEDIKVSTENTHNRINYCDNRLSDMEHRCVGRNHQMKHFLEKARNQEKWTSAQ